MSTLQVPPPPSEPQTCPPAHLKAELSDPETALPSSTDTSSHPKIWSIKEKVLEKRRKALNVLLVVLAVLVSIGSLGLLISALLQLITYYYTKSLSLGEYNSGEYNWRAMTERLSGYSLAG